jgi:3-carboxy-cis,cis-muconate cycloisomerase
MYRHIHLQYILTAFRQRLHPIRKVLIVATTVFDSALFRDMFGTAPMREVFDDRAYVARCIDAETALARAQAKAGLIPAMAAAEITERASVERIDFDALRAETEIVGYPILGLVRQLSAMCGDAGRYVHWGATTQDIMDTATMLQCKQAVALIETQLTEVRRALRSLAETHANTVTAGRSHLQHALPVTFGFRAAVWLSALNRHAERLAQARERALMVEFGGAAGTLASLGDPGPALAVRAGFAAELGLSDPQITWHVARDGLVELVSLLAAIGGSLGKIAYDVMLMASNEFGELAEPFVEGRGASSTMPQKRNPISSELMLAASKMLRERAALMLDAMVQDFERATGPWHLEWSAVPESFLLASSALGQAAFMLNGLSVDRERMRSNLDLTGGLIVAEAVMMGLAPALGRQQAHDIVYDACRSAIEQKRSLYSVLCENADIVARLGEPRIRELTDPANYLGAAERMALAVVQATVL